MSSYAFLAKLVQGDVTCDNCGEKIDATDTQHLQAVIAKSKWESVKTIIDYLGSAGYSCAGIERVLEIPQRTLSQWRAIAPATDATEPSATRFEIDIAIKPQGKVLAMIAGTIDIKRLSKRFGIAAYVSQLFIPLGTDTLTAEIKLYAGDSLFAALKPMPMTIEFIDSPPQAKRSGKTKSHAAMLFPNASNSLDK